MKAKFFHGKVEGSYPIFFFHFLDVRYAFVRLTYTYDNLCKIFAFGFSARKPIEF